MISTIIYRSTLFVYIIFMICISIYTPITYGSSIKYINYPFNTTYYILNAKQYVYYDYDQDGVVELIYTTAKTNGLFIKGVLIAMNTTCIEKYIYLWNFTPYRLFTVDNTLYIIGYFINESTYGILMFGKNLDLIGFMKIYGTYPENPYLYIPPNPLVIKGFIIFALPMIGEGSNYTDLIVCNSFNNTCSIVCHINGPVILVNPITYKRGYYLWGPYILDSDYNIVEKIRIENDAITVFDQVLLYDKLYLIFRNSYSLHVIIYDLNKHYILKTIDLGSGYSYGFHLTDNPFTIYLGNMAEYRVNNSYIINCSASIYRLELSSDKLKKILSISGYQWIVNSIYNNDIYILFGNTTSQKFTMTIIYPDDEIYSIRHPNVFKEYKDLPIDLTITRQNKAVYYIVFGIHGVFLMKENSLGENIEPLDEPLFLASFILLCIFITIAMKHSTK